MNTAQVEDFVGELSSTFICGLLTLVFKVPGSQSSYIDFGRIYSTFCYGKMILQEEIG